MPLLSATCTALYACSVGLCTGLKRSLAYLQSSRAHGAELCISKTSSVSACLSSDPAQPLSALRRKHRLSRALQMPKGRCFSPLCHQRGGENLAHGDAACPLAAAQASPSLAALLCALSMRKCGTVAGMPFGVKHSKSLYPFPGQGTGHLAAEGKQAEASRFSLLWSYHCFLPQPEFLPL